MVLSSITTADASSRLNWRTRRFKCTRPFRRKTKSGFCACAITFQLASNKNAHWMRTAMDPRLSYTRTHIEWGGFWNNNSQGYLYGIGWVEHSLTHSLTHWQERPVPVQHEWTKGQTNPPPPPPSNRNTASLLFVTCSSTILPRSFHSFNSG